MQRVDNFEIIIVLVQYGMRGKCFVGLSPVSLIQCFKLHFDNLHHEIKTTL